MLVEEIMTSDPAAVEETATIGEVWEVLSELEVRHVPVVREGEVVGIISDRDLRELGLNLITDMSKVDLLKSQMGAPVSSLMSSDVITVNRTAELTEVIDLMVEEKIGAIPVVDAEGSELVGIVSYVDVLRALRDSA